MQRIWEEAWLSYRKEPQPLDIQSELTGSVIAEHAIEELRLGSGYLPAGVTVRLVLMDTLPKEGYRVDCQPECICVAGGDENGVLYGVFCLLRKAVAGEALCGVTEQAPSNPLRMLNHWDNLDGSIERGYAGGSFFFEEARVVPTARLHTYARLCASVGINGVVLNNVNVRYEATELITDRYLPQVREIAELLAGYGIRTFLSLNFAAPITIGGMQTCDPCDAAVALYWEKQMQHVYAAVPMLGGFLVKADSEGRPGPFTYGRTHAEGANVLARAVAPYGGIIIWRCFVYNCQQDWRDTKTDRARAGYDHFAPLDGSFLDNVILQIKNGPMDFQVREPVSPLFGGMSRTNQMLEVQAAQEYTGQQKHICYLVPMWKEILDFETYATANGAKVSELVSGRTFGQKNCGMCAVANTGDDANWTGSDLAAANWYGFGRLAFDTALTSEEIAREWIRLTYGQDTEVEQVLLSILLGSWHTYEKYTSPLGIGWMVNPSHHYGPNVEGYEYDRWGTYHRATCRAIGVERNSTGTGYTTQYRKENAERFEHVETTPEELLLFFHRVPYDYRLKDGRTLLQYIYDTHFEGVEEVREMLRLMEGLKGKLPELPYARIWERLHVQLASAEEWRDRVNTYFYRMTEIPDCQGRKIYE